MKPGLRAVQLSFIIPGAWSGSPGGEILEDCMKRASWIVAGAALGLGIAAALYGASAAEKPKNQGHGMGESGSSSRKIDKSCLMVCDRWGDNGCEKWVMRCKGDVGYPSGGAFSR
jgi:hypothetical protein